MVLAAAIGAAGSIAGGLLASSGGTSAYQSAQLAKAQNKIQQRYDTWYLNNISKNQLLNGPDWTRKGYESAGFNPMLTYMNGVGQFTNAGNVSMPNVQRENRANTIADAINTGVQNVIGAYQAEADVNNTNANTALQNSQTLTEAFKQLNYQADTQLKNIEFKLKNVDLKYSEREHLIQQQKDIMESKTMWMNALSNQTMSNASQINAETNRAMIPINAHNAKYGSITRFVGSALENIRGRSGFKGNNSRIFNPSN